MSFLTCRRFLEVLLTLVEDGRRNAVGKGGVTVGSCRVRGECVCVCFSL